MTPFQEDDLDPSIRRWITEWVNLMEQFLLHQDSSVIMLQKIENMFISADTNTVIEGAITEFFLFFFQSRNISMQTSTARAYARFIQKNISRSIQKYLHKTDSFLRDENHPDDNTLFEL